MAYILHIETSGPICSVAISKDGKLLGSLESTEANAHGNLITILINQLLEKNDLSIKSLQAVSISSGPGSYTGLRIGSSTAKGISYALEIPLIAISTLELMQQESSAEQTLVLIDARRMDAYAAFFKNRQILWEKNITMEKGFFQHLLDEQGIYQIIGNIGNKLESLEINQKITYTDTTIPNAATQAEIAYKKWEKQEFEAIDLYTPNYLKTWEEGQKQQK